MTQDPRLDRLEVAVEHLETEIQTLRGDMNSLRGDMNSRFSEMNSRMNVLTQIAFGNVAATILTAVGIVLAVILTR